MDAYCGHELAKQRVEANREIFSRAAATTRWPWTPLGVKSGLRQRYSVAAAFRGPLARHARVIPERRNLLAPFTALAAAGNLGECLAATAAPAGPTGANRLGRGLCGCHVPAGQKGGDAVGKTMRGKGMKLVLAVERHGTPLGVYVCSASPPNIMWRNRCWPPFECHARAAAVPGASPGA